MAASSLALGRSHSQQGVPLTTTVFVVVVLLRFFVPLAIPRFPLPAILASLVLDAADQSIFQMFTDDPLPGYQTYDKALDVYYLAVAYTSTMRNWRDPVAFRTARFLYLYRLVGVALFELFDARWLLLVFPNTFEYFFIVYEFVRTRWNPLRLGAVAIVAIAAFIWIFIKLPQEWWIHIAKLDFTDFMADYPWMWGVLGGLAVAVAIAVYANRRRIPTPDWPFTVDVDRHLVVPAVPDEPRTVLVCRARREGRAAGADLGDLRPGAARHPCQQRRDRRRCHRPRHRQRRRQPMAAPARSLVGEHRAAVRGDAARQRRHRRRRRPHRSPDPR